MVGARNSIHTYNASTNRLDTINSNGVYTGYAYDNQGNITGRGTQGYYFDQGNRMQLANGVARQTSGSGLAFPLPPTYCLHMSRPLRIEFPGAVYHVTSRGDRREAIYLDDADRVAQLAIIEQAMERFDAQVLAYCLMGNHFHLVLHTRQPNLSRLMRHVNGVYTQAYNHRHGLVGHLFQGRFKAILVDRDAYLLALCRYVERNPVAAGMVARVGDWLWSSYRAHVGAVPTPDWLDSDGLHGHLLGHSPAGPKDQWRAAQRYAALVGEARTEDASFWQEALRGQVFLGDEAFVERMQALAAPHLVADKQIPKAQRHRLRTWQDCLAQCGDRSHALHMAYRECGATMTALAHQTGLSVSHVSRLIAAHENAVRSEGKKKT